MKFPSSYSIKFSSCLVRLNLWLIGTSFMYIKNNIIEFNNKFKKYTNNYTLLCIFNLTNKDNNYHVFTYFDNIHFLELHTISNSDGNNYINNNDTIYFDNTIKNKYEFNIEKIENK